MRRINALSTVVIIISVSTLFGCGVGGLKSATHGERSTGEDFDPFDFGDEFTQTDFGRNTASQSSPDERAEKNTGSESLHDRDSLESSDRYRGSGPGGEGLSSDTFGYRVQIGIFENKENAQKSADYARSKVNLEVYVEFDAPFYRVRVGDFKTRKEAENYVKILKDNGFNDALWVPTKINIK